MRVTAIARGAHTRAVLLAGLLSACAATTATVPDASRSGPDRATRIKYGIQSPVDVDEAIATPCHGDSEVMLRGLAYFRAVGPAAYARRNELIQHISACAQERAARGAMRDALELSRGALTFEPKEAVILGAHAHVRRGFAAPLFARAETERAGGALAAELYDLTLGLFIWPEQVDAAARAAEVASTLGRQSSYGVVVAISADASARAFDARALTRELSRTIDRPLVEIESPPSRSEGGRGGEIAATTFQAADRADISTLLRLQVRFARRSVTQSRAACPSVEVVIEIEGATLQNGKWLDLAPVREKVGDKRSECFSMEVPDRVLQADLEQRVVERLGRIIRAAYDQEVLGWLQQARAHVHAGRPELALEPYMRFRLHREGPAVGAASLSEVDVALLGTRELDREILARIDGFWDRFHPMARRAAPTGGVVADGPAL